MSTRKEIKNVFEAILEYGHDEDFVPYEGEQFQLQTLQREAMPRSKHCGNACFLASHYGTTLTARITLV